MVSEWRVCKSSCLLPFLFAAMSFVVATDTQNGSGGCFLDYSNRSLATFDDKLECVNGTLDLSFNIFEILNLGHATDVAALNFTHNSLTHIVTLPIDVYVLDISWNKLSKLSEEMEALSKLEYLFVCHNELNVLDSIPTKCNLQVVEASWNSISSIDSSLSECKTLRRLDLSQNPLKELDPGVFQLTSLEWLDISHNSLRHLDMELEGCKNLRWLNVSSNNLQVVSGSWLEQLELLDASNNALDKYPATDQRNLHWLNLSDNALVSTHFLANLASAHAVDLRNNGVHELDFEFLRENRTVDVRGNQMTATTIAQIVREDGVEMLAEETQCMCGWLRRASAEIRLCLDVNCPGTYGTWIDFVESLLTTTIPPTSASTETSSIKITFSDDFTSTPSATTNASAFSETGKVVNKNSTEPPQLALLTIGRAAKFSFVILLLLTVVIVYIVIRIVGDPVYDDRWWELKIPVDNPIT